jgi:serine phosphatase RsbU (regulator of sigma subunit)/pSer/pThr/pTyr-binding forkhead associated (FHA) protein
MIHLEVTPAEGDPFNRKVEGAELVIGRSTKCDLSISDRFLSRQHARMFRSGNDWMIEDLGSRNGTFVNGERISSTKRIRPGDTIAMSASVVKVVPEASTDLPRGDMSTSDIVLKPASDVLLSTRTPPPSETTDENLSLTRYAERLAIVNEVHQALARSIALDELLDLILERAFEHLQPEHGAVFLKDGRGHYERAAGRSVHEASGQLAYSESLKEEVAEKGMAAMVLDAQTDQRFAGAQSLVNAGVRSLIAAPLLDPAGALGLIVLSSNAAVRKFSESDLELLVTLASVAAMRIRNVSLAEEAAERRRLERELTLARRIQVGLFPEHLPELDGYELYGGNAPSRGVSGDYYEVLERADEREAVLLVADVSGKGMSASLLTGYLEALTSVPIEAGLEPDEVFNQISRPFFRRTPANRFATMILVALDRATGRIRYSNAGHTPGFVIRASGELAWLPATGLPIGIFPDAEYRSEETALGPGDVLVLYSDGYTEAENPAEEQFGAERLADVCVRHREGNLEEMAMGLEQSLEDFARGTPFADDRTLVIARRRQ